MMLPAIDAHAHIEVRIAPRELSELNAAVLAVTRSAAEWYVASARDDDLTLWGLGCHPALTAAVRAFDERAFGDALETAAFVGEVGIDRRSDVPIAEQVEVFTNILRAVQRVPRAVSIHSTGVTRTVLELLEAHPIRTPILHWWRGTPQETSRAVELGCFFSLNGHEAKSPKTIDVIPPERMLTETDFPHSTRYDASASRPAATETIERALMGHHGLTRVELRQILWRNLHDAFAPALDVVPASRRVGRLLRESRTASVGSRPTPNIDAVSG
jgi:TatD DNase family protein